MNRHPSPKTNPFIAPFTKNGSSLRFHRCNRSAVEDWKPLTPVTPSSTAVIPVNSHCSRVTYPSCAVYPAILLEYSVVYHGFRVPCNLLECLSVQPVRPGFKGLEDRFMFENQDSKGNPKISGPLYVESVDQAKQVFLDLF
ncbi:hypothetical protein E3N88_25665 [Mikania micrantha]|uniref:Uncharacterized protein n=1 Tax=Mikania micrantha TaxID=192012 RepID=A0A5N6N5S2_9ASTR|nr:hypothetical protein E3N88_25665 [Mikania micrantha]